MHGSSLLKRGLNVRTLLLGVIIGGSAALPLYLWQHETAVAIACWIVVGYTTWLWAATAEAVSDYRHRCEDLSVMPFNNRLRRLRRMFGDVGYWWSTLFGCATVTGSAWYVGIQNPITLGGIGAGWCCVSSFLNYGLTLLHPTTRCRRCFYQLAAHLERAESKQKVQCPECGARWSKIELGLELPKAAKAVQEVAAVQRMEMRDTLERPKLVPPASAKRVA